MNRLLEFFKELFGLSDEQIERVQDELKNEEKTEETPAEEKKDEKVEDTADGVGTQPAGVDEEVKGDEDMSVSAEDYKKLQDELAAVKGLLEKQTADALKEKRMNKINGYKDCRDTSYLSTLLEGVEEKDMDKKVEEIKKEKAYLFSKPETEGFNPSEPNTKMNGVEAAFYRNNPDLRPSQSDY